MLCVQCWSHLVPLTSFFPHFNANRLKQETHQIAARKVEQMGRLRGAFGIGETKEGDAFDRELQDRRRQEKIAERENREQERR